MKEEQGNAKQWRMHSNHLLYKSKRIVKYDKEIITPTSTTFGSLIINPSWISCSIHYNFPAPKFSLILFTTQILIIQIIMERLSPLYSCSFASNLHTLHQHEWKLFDTEPKTPLLSFLSSTGGSIAEDNNQITSGERERETMKPK